MAHLFRMHLCASCSDSYSTHMSAASWVFNVSPLAASSLFFQVCKSEQEQGAKHGDLPEVAWLVFGRLRALGIKAT